MLFLFPTVFLSFSLITNISKFYWFDLDLILTTYIYFFNCHLNSPPALPVVFYHILFYYILFYSILLHYILIYSILFFTIAFYFILLYSTLFYFHLTYSYVTFCSIISILTKHKYVTAFLTFFTINTKLFVDYQNMSQKIIIIFSFSYHRLLLPSVCTVYVTLESPWRKWIL